MSHYHTTILVSGKCRLVATLGECDRANVAHNIAIGCLFEFPQMGVAIHKDVVSKCGTVLLVVHVAVCKKQTTTIVDNKSIVCHYRELEQHLVYLGIAVATNGDDAILHSVKALDDALRVDALGYAVAWSVVENVAKDAQHVVMALVEEVEDALECGEASVNI